MSKIDIIEWRDSYSVGVAKIDEHHKKLLKLIEQVDYTIRKEKGKGVGMVLNELTLYTAYHFKEEERLMEKYCYPGIEKHKALHRIFKDRLNEMFSVADSEIGHSFQVMKLLADWLIDHILIEDKKYSKYIPDEE